MNGPSSFSVTLSFPSWQFAIFNWGKAVFLVLPHKLEGFNSTLVWFGDCGKWTIAYKLKTLLLPLNVCHYCTTYLQPTSRGSDVQSKVSPLPTLTVKLNEDKCVRVKSRIRTVHQAWENFPISHLNGAVNGHNFKLLIWHGSMHVTVCAFVCVA